MLVYINSYFSLPKGAFQVTEQSRTHVIASVNPPERCCDHQYTEQVP